MLQRLGQTAHEMPSLLGAMVYGSVTFKPTRRSDLDVLTVFSNHVGADELHMAAGVYAETAETFNVPPEPNTIIVTPHMKPHDHMLDSMFGEHLRFTQTTRPEWALGTPVDHLPFRELDQQEAFDVSRNYSAYKERLFLKAISEKRGILDVSILQRAFETPSSMARKAIGAIDFATLDDPAQLGRERLAVRAEELLHQIGSDEHGVWAHRRLKMLDSEYTDLLEGVIEGDIYLEEYTSWLNRYNGEALHKARELATTWKTIISEYQHHF